MNRPRPVITKASIAGLITSIAGVLTFLGYSQQATDLSTGSQSIAGVAIGIVLLASHILPALSAQKEVTPLVDPMTSASEQLIPAGTIVPPYSAPSAARHAAEPVDFTPIPDPPPPEPTV